MTEASLFRKNLIFLDAAQPGVASLVRRSTDTITRAVPGAGGRAVDIDIGAGRLYNQDADAFAEAQVAAWRGAYNAAMVDDPRFLFVPGARRVPPSETGLADASMDLVLVPNLVHHVADQDALFAELARITRPGARVYVFEPLLRELHQVPDDYLRWTPFGMARAMRAAGLEPGEPKMAGGPFEAIAYCWVQALEYFPDDKRDEMARWFHETHMPELVGWDAAHSDNLVRQNTSFPVAYSITATRPA